MIQYENNNALILIEDNINHELFQTLAYLK